MGVAPWYVSRGRIDRSTFWLRYVLPILGATVVAGLLDVLFGFTDTRPASGTGFEFDSTAGPIGQVVSLLLLVPNVSSGVTRLHDRGHSAWWLLWLLLPVVGWLLLIVQMGFLRSDGPNRYGYPSSPTGGPGTDPPYPATYR